VQEALDNLRWVSDIRGALSVDVMFEYLLLWDLLDNFQLQPDVPDVHVWKFSTSGQYSTKSAYDAMFEGATKFSAADRIWKSWAPGKCKFFLWFAAHDRCWTADRLARRGLDHPASCPLCDQTQESINHLLISCVFARQFWFNLLQHVGLQDLSPQPDESSFDSWWFNCCDKVPRQFLLGLNSLIILGAWMLWKHHNRCVFDGLSPSGAAVLSAAREEVRLWCLAGAKGLSSLPAGGGLDH
jgi:hypothetical protein